RAGGVCMVAGGLGGGGEWFFLPRGRGGRPRRGKVGKEARAGFFWACVVRRENSRAFFFFPRHSPLITRHFFMPFCFSRRRLFAGCRERVFGFRRSVRGNPETPG